MEINYEKFLTSTVEMIIKPLAEDLKITLSKEGDQYRINIDSSKNELLVGHRGENIKAIQHIIRVIIHKNYPGDRTHFLIDVGEYKKGREALINEVIPEITKKEVIESGRSVILTKLNSYERKLVHTLLSEIKGVATSSIGEDGDRKLIMRPTEDSGGFSTVENAKIIDIETYIADSEDSSTEV